MDIQEQTKIKLMSQIKERVAGDMITYANTKFYVPDITEFYVGFEYEYSYPDMPNKDVQMYDKIPLSWNKSLFNPYSNANLKRDENSINDNIKYGYIRVKYLDKEDIESLGFILNNNESSELYLSFNKNDLWLQLTTISGVTKLGIKDIELDSFLFIGIIKNKSELIKLLKQLGINE